jgi:F-type H+-transporting ATPase subunit epsilon
MADAIPPLPTRLTLEIVTPDQSLVSEEVEEVVVPAWEGYLGVLPGHAPLLAVLKIGEMWYRKGSEKTYLAIAGGFLEVLPDKVTILAHIAERPEDIDVARAEAAKRRAEERFNQPTGEMDFERARIAMMKSLARLQVAARARTRG